MKLPFRRTLFAPALCWLLFGAFSSAPAQDLASKGREVFKKYQTTVVTVQLVLKIKFGVPGLGGDGRESKQEISGTVIDPSGLTVVALSSTDPAGMMQSFMSLGGDGDDNPKFKMDTELSDVKLLGNDGSEWPAEIVLRDKDLDLAFVRPKVKPDSPLPALDLGKNAKVEVLDEVIALNRLGKVAGRAYAVAVERINAVVQKPRLFYVPGGDATATGLGCPAFTPDGKLVGIFVMRSIKSAGEGGGGMFGFQSSPIATIILPADEVKKVASQVPAVKEGAK